MKRKPKARPKRLPRHTLGDLALRLQGKVDELRSEKEALHEKYWDEKYGRQREQREVEDIRQAYIHLENRNKVFAGLIGELQDLTRHGDVTLTRAMVDDLVANGRAWKGLGRG